MRYLPCERCQYDADTCEVRQRVSDGVREFNQVSGERLTSAKFTCDRRLEGFEVGARVIVTERTWIPFVDTEIHGTVLEHRGHKVRVWLDSETGEENRLITIYPTPIREDGAIGVVPTGESVSWEDAYAEMIREARKNRGDHGDDHFYCPDCEKYFAALRQTSTGVGFFAEHDDEVYPDCGNANAGCTEEFAERGLLPEQEGSS